MLCAYFHLSTCPSGSSSLMCTEHWLFSIGAFHSQCREKLGSSQLPSFHLLDTMDLALRLLLSLLWPLRNWSQELPGRPVVRTLHFHYPEPGFDSRSRNQEATSLAVQPKQNTKKSPKHTKPKSSQIWLILSSYINHIMCVLSNSFDFNLLLFTSISLCITYFLICCNVSTSARHS